MRRLVHDEEDRCYPSHHHESTGPAAACALQGPAFLVRGEPRNWNGTTADVASGRLATIRLPNNVVPRPDSAAISIRRVARLSRNVGQPDPSSIRSLAIRRSGGRGPAKLACRDQHHGCRSSISSSGQVLSGFRQVRASNFNLPSRSAFSSRIALEIILNEPGVGADRLQRARNDPFRLVPPRRREGVFLCIPFRMIVVPVTHDLIHLATVDTARLPLSLLDEVAEERGAWRKRQMVDSAVQGLVHSEHKPSHTTSFLTRASARF